MLASAAGGSNGFHIERGIFLVFIGGWWDFWVKKNQQILGDMTWMVTWGRQIYKMSSCRSCSLESPGSAGPYLFLDMYSYHHFIPNSAKPSGGQPLNGALFRLAVWTGNGSTTGDVHQLLSWDVQLPISCDFHFMDWNMLILSRWWQLKDFLFSPRSLGKWSNLTHIFQLSKPVRGSGCKNYIHLETGGDGCKGFIGMILLSSLLKKHM